MVLDFEILKWDQNQYFRVGKTKIGLEGFTSTGFELNFQIFFFSLFDHGLDQLCSDFEWLQIV